jgi:hypothetical protein
LRVAFNGEQRVDHYLTGGAADHLAVLLNLQPGRFGAIGTLAGQFQHLAVRVLNLIAGLNGAPEVCASGTQIRRWFRDGCRGEGDDFCVSSLAMCASVGPFFEIRN